MNIHEAVLQPIAEFVYSNRHAAAGRRRQAKVGNFHASAGACATELRRLLGSEITLFQHKTTSKVI